MLSATSYCPSTSSKPTFVLISETVTGGVGLDQNIRSTSLPKPRSPAPVKPKASNWEPLIHANRRKYPATLALQYMSDPEWDKSWGKIIIYPLACLDETRSTIHSTASTKNLKRRLYMPSQRTFLHSFGSLHSQVSHV